MAPKSGKGGKGQRKAAAPSRWVMGPGGTLVERASVPAGLTPLQPAGEPPRLSALPAAITQQRIVKPMGGKGGAGGVGKRRAGSAASSSRSASVSSTGSAATEATTKSGGLTPLPDRSDFGMVGTVRGGSRSPGLSPLPDVPRADPPAKRRRAAAAPAATEAPRVDEVNAIDAVTVKPSREGVTSEAISYGRPGKSLQDMAGERRRAALQTGTLPSLGALPTEKPAASGGGMEHLPPYLTYLPGSAGYRAGMPGEIRDHLTSTGKLVAGQPAFFELRAKTREARPRCATVAVSEWQAPWGCITLPPHIARPLDMKPDEHLTIKQVHPPPCTRLVLEVPRAAVDAHGEDGLRAAVAAHFEKEGVRCVSDGEIFRVVQFRCKVLSTRPSAPVALPAEDIFFKVRSEAQIPVLKASSDGGGSLRTSEGMVRVVASSTSAAEPTCLRLLAKTRDNQPANTLLYVALGDARPTLEAFEAGGANSVEFVFESTLTCHVLVKGDGCVLHAHVLRRAPPDAGRGAPPGAAATATAGDHSEAPSDYSAAVLKHFRAVKRTPAPSEVEARLPAGIDVAYLSCLEELLCIEGTERIPSAAQWVDKLPTATLAGLPLLLRISLLLNVAPAAITPAHVPDLRASLQTPLGEDALLTLFEALGRADAAPRRAALQILRCLSDCDAGEDHKHHKHA